MSYLIRRVLAKPRLILDEMCRLYRKFASCLCKTRLIFPRINGPIVYFTGYGVYYTVTTFGFVLCVVHFVTLKYTSLFDQFRLKRTLTSVKFKKLSRAEPTQCN